MSGLLIISFVFGAIIGSFLNVIIYRAKTGMGVGGRSMCMSCGKTLCWYELVPIASFVVQWARCRNCKSKISWQYPIVELVTGILFALTIYLYPPLGGDQDVLRTIIYLAISCFLVVITVYDFKHKIIPDVFVFLFDLFALATVFIGGATWFHAPHIWTLLAGPILALPFALLWLVSRGRWIGLGDAKLVLGIGWLLGLNAGANALILAFWIGAVISVAWMLIVYRKIKHGVEIPFGPFLVIGTYLVWLLGLIVVDFRILSVLF